MVRSSDVNDPLEYNIENNTATVVNINYTENKDIVIPETVTLNENNYTVTTIAKSAFKTSYITNITIPASITLIDDEAFRDSNLIIIHFKGELPTIGKDAFSDMGDNFPLGSVNNKLNSWQGVNHIDDLTIKNMSLYIKNIISLIIIFILIFFFSKKKMSIWFKIPLYLLIITYLPYFQIFINGHRDNPQESAIMPIILLIAKTLLLIFLYLINKISIVWLKIPLFIFVLCNPFSFTLIGMDIEVMLELPDYYIRLFM